MRTSIVAAALAVASLVAAMVIAPVLATAVLGFLTIENAKVTVIPDNDRLRAKLTTEQIIPTDGSGDAFGYGILTDDGDALVVSTTHAGVLDSEKQSFIQDPLWHNHFVRLGDVDQCGDDPGVVDISWQSPGTLIINNKIARIAELPTDGFDGTHSITGEELSFVLGEDVANVVSFKLAPVFGSGGLEAVCVTDIMPAEDLQIAVVD